VGAFLGKISWQHGKFRNFLYFYIFKKEVKMGDTIDSKKIRLVNKITSTQDEALLDLLEKVFDSSLNESGAIWTKVVKPVRERQTIEDMVREQDFHEFDRTGFDKIIEELDIKDPEGELLKPLIA
jgi:hypothetical protein